MPFTNRQDIFALAGLLVAAGGCSDGERGSADETTGGVAGLITPVAGGSANGSVTHLGGTAAGTSTTTGGNNGTSPSSAGGTGGGDASIAGIGGSTASVRGGSGTSPSTNVSTGGSNMAAAGGTTTGGLAAGTSGGTAMVDAALDSSSDGDAPDATSNEPTPVVLSDDGGWCWFESPRAVMVGSKVIVGSIAAGYLEANRRGDVEAIVHDVDTGVTSIVELHDRLELDDHDSPALLVRPDGRLLTLYSKHSAENRFYYRISQPNDPLSWDEEQTFVPSPSSNLTYSNLYSLSAENDRVYDFYRGLDSTAKPSFAYSDDLGQTWVSGNVIINASGALLQRPYVRYASNHRDTIHLIYTDGHPRDVNNSLYHVFYRDEMLHRSDGTSIAALTQGLAEPNEGTLIFPGDAQNVAWVSAVVLDGAEHPVTVYSVQVGSAGLPAGKGGDDLRYRYARCDGSRWNDYPLAFAGTRLYPAEDDYTGLVIVDPSDPSTVYLSTNADPASGSPLTSAADGARHYEIFRGRTLDGGQSWQFIPVTRNSSTDNLRPLMPSGAAGQTRVLLWLRGQYRSYTDYQLQVVARISRDHLPFDEDAGAVN